MSDIINLQFQPSVSTKFSQVYCTVHGNDFLSNLTSKVFLQRRICFTDSFAEECCLDTFLLSPLRKLENTYKIARVYSRNWPMRVNKGPFFKKGGPLKVILHGSDSQDALPPFWNILGK